jgi:hypothetical protein
VSGRCRQPGSVLTCQPTGATFTQVTSKAAVFYDGWAWWEESEHPPGGEYRIYKYFEIPWDDDYYFDGNPGIRDPYGAATRLPLNWGFFHAGDL